MGNPAILPDNDLPQSVETRLASLEARMNDMAIKEDLQAFCAELRDGLRMLKFDLIKIMAWSIWRC